MRNLTFVQTQRKYWLRQQHRYRRSPKHPVVEAYVLPKINYIFNQLRFDCLPSIIDVGAGNGFFSFWWGKVGDITAIDYSEVLIKNNPVKNKYVMDARSLDFPDDSFDLSFCSALLHHIDRDDRAIVIREMARVSRKYVAIIEPNRNNPLMALFGMLKREERGSLSFSLRYCKRLLEEAGLHILNATSWGLLTPNRMPLAKMLLPLCSVFERPLPLGMNNIVLAEKPKISCGDHTIIN